MKDLKTIILLSVIGVLVIIIAFNGCGKKGEINQALQDRKYDSLQGNVDRLKKDNKTLALMVDSLQTHIDSIQSAANYKETSIADPFKGFDKKDSIIKSYSVKELEKELARRFDNIEIKPTDSTATISKKAGQEILSMADSFVVVKEINHVKGEIIEDYKKIVSGKDAQLFLKDRQIENKDQIINDLELQKLILQNESKYLTRKLKRSRFKTTVSQIVLLVTLGALIVK